MTFKTFLKSTPSLRAMSRALLFAPFAPAEYATLLSMGFYRGIAVRLDGAPGGVQLTQDAIREAFHA